VERAVARGGLTAEQVEARIDAQLSNDERKAHADVVIDNSGSEEQLERRIEILRAGLEKPAAS
jgi:dephospho-CoA kinase